MHPVCLYRLLPCPFETAPSPDCSSPLLHLFLQGSTACVTFSYIFPGALVLKSKEAADQGCGARTLAKGTIGLACTMAALSIFNTLTGRADMG